MEDWIAKAIKSSKEIAASLPMEKGGADPDFARESYEEHWGKRLPSIQKKIAAGETVAHIMTFLRNQPHLVRPQNVAKAITQALFSRLDEVTSDGKPTTRLGVSGSHFIAQSNFDPMTAIFQNAEKADFIVEVGAGPGWNLFNLSTYLGKSIIGKKIFGLEITKSGLEVIRLLADYDNLPVEAHFFDYRNPDLSMLPTTGNTLIFTHHSLEQVEEISPMFHQTIAKRTAPTKIIHCEPIGWQRFPELYKARVRGDDDLFKAMVVRRFDDLSADHAVAMSSAINSWRARYNRNAMNCIKKHVNAGRFILREEIYDFTHIYNRNPLNPSTYLEIDVAP